MTVLAMEEGMLCWAEDENAGNMVPVRVENTFELGAADEGCTDQ